MENNLTLISRRSNYGIAYDLWENSSGQVFMTAVQLAQIVGYKDKKGIENVLNRNEYLKEPEFSTTLKLNAVDGKLRDTRVFTEDGIYEIAMLARTEEGKKFRAKIRRIIREMSIKKVVDKLPKETFTECGYMKETGEAQSILLDIMHSMPLNKYVDWYDRNIQAKREREWDKVINKKLKEQKSNII